ncbi:hypothetical protein [Providencia sp. PROV214]|uniref:hypothetical protein n=1 Tax=Providencia sp. PROV214 TaxID=2949910 RepID=UPI00234BB97A|nr:hypothetical protein [Providencia sp. PROV214]
MGNEQNKSTGGKAIGIAGGGGAGAIIIQLIEVIGVNPEYKNIYIALVPAISVILSEFFSFIVILISLDPNKLRFRIWLKITKWRLWWGMRKKISTELKELAESRYNICVGIEMGIYKMEDYWNSAPAPSSSPAQTPPTSSMETVNESHNSEK